MQLWKATTIILIHSVGALYIQNNVNDFSGKAHTIPLLEREKLKGAEAIIGEYTQSPSISTVYEKWISPDGSYYVVPRINSTNIEESQRYQSGFKLLDSEKYSPVTGQSTVEKDDVVYLEEENVISMGFPWLWSKADCEETDSQESHFPFGARKFFLVGVKRDKRSLSMIDDMEYDQNQNEVVSTKFPFWHSDDCDGEDTENQKLFGTDKFLFVGIGSVNNGDTKNINTDQDDTYLETTPDSEISSNFISTQSKKGFKSNDSMNVNQDFEHAQDKNKQGEDETSNKKLNLQNEEFIDELSPSMSFNDLEVAVGNGSFLIHHRTDEEYGETGTPSLTETIERTNNVQLFTPTKNIYQVKNNQSTSENIIPPTINYTKSVSKDDSFHPTNLSKFKDFKNEGIRHDHWSYFGALVALTIAVVSL